MSFAAALYGAQGSLRGRVPCKPAKTEVFGCQFTGVIVLDNSVLKPFGKISGQLAIDSRWNIQHFGIRVQLEANCSLKYETQVDGRKSLKMKIENLLAEDAVNRDPRSTYQQSPVMIDILPQKASPYTPTDDGFYELTPGNHTFRFSLTMSGENLPAEFKTRYGTLRYKLVAYMLGYDWVQVSEKEVRYLGYFNLSQSTDDLTKPLEVKKEMKKSIFSSKRVLTASLRLESCGYVIGEDINFTLTVDNPKCLPLKMWITLNQRCVYNIDGARKTTVALLDSAANEVTEPGIEYAWASSLNVPKAAAPSYCKHHMYTTSHILQFKVKVDDYSGSQVKAEVPLFIGTTRDSMELLIISANSLSVVDDRFPARRGSSSSIHSDSSGLTHFTSLPPPYSQLPSRVPSLETLPPAYDEGFLGVAKNGQRRRSCLEFHVIPPEDTSENYSPQPGDMTPASTPVTDD